MSSDRAVKLNLWGSTDSSTFSLAIDHGDGRRVTGVVLSRPLAKVALRARVPSAPMDAISRRLLDPVLQADGQLEDQLDVGTVFNADGRGLLLKGLTLSPERPEPIVVLLAEQPKPGSTSLIQLDSGGVAVGGFTIQVRDRTAGDVER